MDHKIQVDDNKSVTNLEMQIDSNKLICKFFGRMETSPTLKVEKDIIDYLESKKVKSIEFDLSEVTYIASYFLRLCSIAVTSLESPKYFSVSNTRPEVYKVFKMAGLNKELNVSEK